MLKVLISIDEPELAKFIVHTACAIFNKDKTEITLVNVLEETAAEEAYFSSEPQKFIKHEAEKTDFAYIENFLEENYNYKGFIYKEGKASDNILQIAQNENYDLIVVGSHNKHGIERLFLGSVSNHILKHSKCSVLVVKPFPSREIGIDKPYSVLLPVDSSQYAEKAARNLSRYVDIKRASVDILNVTVSLEEILPADALIYSDIQRIMDESAITSKELIDSTAQIIENKNIRVNKKYYVIGDAASVILEESENNNNDLIVMGSHGTSGIGRWLIGSVSLRVFEHSNIPVIIIK